jgi:predicted nucleic acid-binding protein
VPVPSCVLDTNVLVPALRSSTGASYRLVQLVGRGLLEIGPTAPLVLEYEAVGKRLVGASGLTPEDVDDLVDYLCRVGRRCPVYFRVRPSVADPDDELVLEAAVASGSGWIVTHTVRDLADGAARYGVEVLTPAEALARLGVKK